MCGIVAMFNLREQTPELREKALRMSRKIRHRVIGAAFGVEALPFLLTSD